MYPFEFINKFYELIHQGQKPEINIDDDEQISTELQIWDSQYPNYVDADLPAKIKTIALYLLQKYKLNAELCKLIVKAAMINPNDFESWFSLSSKAISESGLSDLQPIYRGAFYLRMACLIGNVEKESSNKLSNLLIEKMIVMQWKDPDPKETWDNSHIYELKNDSASPASLRTCFYLFYSSVENNLATDNVSKFYLPLSVGMLRSSKLYLKIFHTEKDYFVDKIKSGIEEDGKLSESTIPALSEQLQTINKKYLTFVKNVVEKKADGKIIGDDLYPIFSATTLPLIWEHNRLYGKEISLSDAYKGLLAIQQILEINKIKNPLLSSMVDYQIAVCSMQGMGTIKDIPTAIERFTASFKVAVELKDPSTQYLCLNALKNLAENCEIPAHKILAKLALAECYKIIAEDQDHSFKVRDLTLAQELYQEIKKPEHSQWVNAEQREAIQKSQTEVSEKIKSLKELAITEQAKLFFQRGCSAANSKDVKKAKTYLEQSFNLGLLEAGLEYAKTCIDKENPSNFEEAFQYLNWTVEKSVTRNPINSAGLAALEIATKYSNSGYSSQVALMKEKIINCLLNRLNFDLERILNIIINRDFKFKKDKLESYETIALPEEKFLNQFRIKALQLLPIERDKDINHRIAELINKLVSSTNFVSEDIPLALALMRTRDLISVASIDQFFKNAFILLDKLPNLIASDDPNFINIKTQINNLISHLFIYISERLRTKESLPSITELANLFKLLAEKQADLQPTVLSSWLINNRNPLENIISNNITKPETLTVLDALENMGNQQNIEFFKVFVTYYKTMKQKQADFSAKVQLYDETKKGSKASFNKLEKSTDELSKILFYRYVRKLDQDKSGKIYNHYTWGFTKPNPEKNIFPDLKIFAEKNWSAAAMWELAECYRTQYGIKNGNNEDEALWWSFRAGFTDVLNGEYYDIAKAEFTKSLFPQGRLFFYLLTGEKTNENADIDFEDFVKNNTASIVFFLKKIKEIILDYQEIHVLGYQEIHEIKKLKLCERILALKVDKENNTITDIQATYDKLSQLFTIPKASNVSPDNQYVDFLSSLAPLPTPILTPNVSPVQTLTELQNRVLQTPSAPPSAPPMETSPAPNLANAIYQPNQEVTKSSSPEINSVKETIKEEAVATLANQDKEPHKELVEENNQLIEHNKILETENQTLKSELQILKAQMQQLQQNFLTLQRQVDAQKTEPVPQTTLTVSKKTTAQMGGYIKQMVKEAVSETVPKKIKITTLLEQQGAFKKKKTIKKLQVSTKDSTQGTLQVFKPKSPVPVKSPARKNR